MLETADVVVAPGGAVGVVARWVDAVEVVFFDGSRSVFPCEVLKVWEPEGKGE